VARQAEPKFFWKGRAPAFTLVEVMVTLTILGFVLLMIFGVFRLGLSAWAKGESIKEDYQRIRIASQLLSRQMKSAVPYKIKSQKAEGDFLAFEGKARSLKFVSALSLKSRKASGLVYVVYEFQEGGKGGGRFLIYERKAINKNFMDEEPSEEAKVTLFEGLEDVRFEYYQEEDPEKNRAGGWVEEWDAKEEKQLPRAWRVSLSFAREDRQAEEEPILFMASLPSYRYEDIRTTPIRRMIRPVSR
jgi:general secretion pathway protein J